MLPGVVFGGRTDIGFRWIAVVSAIGLDLFGNVRGIGFIVLCYVIQNMDDCF